MKKKNHLVYVYYKMHGETTVILGYSLELINPRIGECQVKPHYFHRFSDRDRYIEALNCLGCPELCE